MSKVENKIIDSPYGRFEIRDARYPGSKMIVRVLPVDPETGEGSMDGSFKINSKVYKGHLDVERGYNSFWFRAYVGWDQSLTSSAYEKLQAVLEPIIAEYPELDDATKFEMTKEQLADRVRYLIAHEIGYKINEVLRDAGIARDLTEQQWVTLKATALHAAQQGLDKLKVDGIR